MTNSLGALIVVTFITSLAFSADECLQINDGPTVVKIDRFSMSVSRGEKPIAGAEFRLEQDNTVAQVTEVRRLSEAKRLLVSQGVTDQNGKLDFGVVAPGTYHLVMTSPSNHEITVQVFSPRPHQRPEVIQVKLDYFCKNLTPSFIDYWIQKEKENAKPYY